MEDSGPDEYGGHLMTWKRWWPSLHAQEVQVLMDDEDVIKGLVMKMAQSDDETEGEACTAD